MRIIKTIGERRIEAATWGLLLVWIGVMMSIDERKGVAAVGAGSILLVSALLQKILGWEAGIVLWALGIGFLLSGLNDLVGRDRNIPVLAVILIVLGAFVFLRALTGIGRRRGAHITIVPGSREPPDDQMP